MFSLCSSMKFFIWLKAWLEQSNGARSATKCGKFLTAPGIFIFSRQSLAHGYIEMLWGHVSFHSVYLFKFYGILHHELI